MNKSTQDVYGAGILLMARTTPVEFLLMRHVDRWDLPKGHCDAGESQLDTALRETEEETGISAKQIELDPDFRFDLSYPVTYKRFGNRTLTKHVRYYLGFLTSKPELVLTEHESAEWIQWSPPHDIQSQTINPLLAAVAKHLG